MWKQNKHYLGVQLLHQGCHSTMFLLNDLVELFVVGGSGGDKHVHISGIPELPMHLKSQKYSG